MDGRPEPTDAEIVRQVQGGDVEAFGLLVDRHHARCLRTARQLLGDADAAEDVVQEAFVRAYRHLGAYRERDRFVAWLLRIVVNQCRTAVAAERRWLRIDERDERDHAIGHDESGGMRLELDLALSRLDPDQREMIALRFGGELSYAEMSKVTGVGISALKMRVHRACARLRTFLTEISHV